MPLFRQLGRGLSVGEADGLCFSNKHVPLSNVYVWGGTGKACRNGVLKKHGLLLQKLLCCPGCYADMLPYDRRTLERAVRWVEKEVAGAEAGITC